jgi:hypothetical protein
MATNTPRKGLNIMGKSAPSPPPAPDPVKTANAQAAANKETAITQSFLNNVNETTPLGSRTFESFIDFPEGFETTKSGISRDDIIFTPGGGVINRKTGQPISATDPDFPGFVRFRSNTTLNPEAQKAFDAEQAVTRGTNELAAGQIGRVSDAVANPFTFEGLPGAPVAGEEGRQGAENAVFDSLSRRLNTQFDRDEDRLRNRLATQGITGGSEAFDNELDQFNTNKNDAFLDASNQAFLAGGAEQNRQFGLDASARDRGIQERSFLRNIPLNEVAALLGTGQVGLPQFGAPAQTGIAPTDVIGATLGSANIASRNNAIEAASANAFNQGLFGLGSSALRGFGSAGGPKKFFGF